jgi:hypothetical protein
MAAMSSRPDASEVRFPLDPLWACAAIDAVGIDYYAPLSDWRDEADRLDTAVADSIYDTSYLAANLRGGEAYDWYYADDAARAAQARSPITDGLGKPWLYRAKDIWAWWANAHYERTGGAELASPTAWTPQSKPIWLTELGCPAVDKGTNQPSTFPDPKSSESRLPHFSNGARDDLVQRRMLEAVLGAFDPAFGASDACNPHSTEYDGRMIDESAVHLWTWDARPFPVFPAALDQWSDGANWQTGHWLTGRLGGAPLDALVTAMLDDSGVTIGDASRLRGTLDGYVVDRPMSPRAMIEPLAQVFAFDAAPVGDALRFLPRGGGVVAEFNEDDLVEPERGARAVLTRAQETELPREVSIGFTDGFRDYRRAAASSRRLVGGSNRTLQADYAVVTDDAAAARRAEILLQDLWAGRERAEFSLGIDRLALTPGDVIAVEVSGRRRLLESRRHRRDRATHDQGAQHRSGCVRDVGAHAAANDRRAAAGRGTGRGDRARSAVSRRQRAAGADAPCGVRRSVARLGDGVAVERWREFYAADDCGGAGDRGRDSGRLARRPGEPLGQGACNTRAASWRRAVVGERVARAWRRECAGASNMKAARGKSCNSPAPNSSARRLICCRGCCVDRPAASRQWRHRCRRVRASC